MDAKSSLSAARELEEHLNSQLVGKKPAVRLLLSALLSGGHVLIEDRPGVGKTTVARAFAEKSGLPMQRIQGTADLLPTDITGVHVYNMSDGTWELNAGPMLAPVVLFDELNRATPKAQSAALEAMAEGTVTIDGVTLELPNPHLVIATQNPAGGPGTFPLVDAQLDRFAATISLGPLGRSGELSLLEDQDQGRSDGPVVPLESGALLAIRKTVDQVETSEHVLNYLLDIVEMLRSQDGEPWLSSRVPLDMLATAKGHAFLSGRSYLAPDDLGAVAIATIKHRMPAQVTANRIRSSIETVSIPEAA